MSLTELHTIFVNRRNNILHILKCQEGSIALDKKHELKGALCEIELFLRTIEYYNKNGIRENAEPHLLTNPDEMPESFFSRMGDFFRKR
jgi:hypothetical protein